MEDCESKIKEINNQIKEKQKFSPGHCSRCNSTNVKIIGARIICLNCNDWEWLEDAIFSCWNGELN